MDLVVVEVLQGEAVAGQQPRHGVGGGHEQAVRVAPFLAVDEVHGGGLGVHEVGADGQLVLGRPLLAGQQHRGGAVGERGGVAGRHGGLGAVGLGVALAEDGLELAQLLLGGVGPHVVVAGHAQVRGDQVVLETRLVGGGEVAVAGRGQGVLVGARDAELAGGDRGVLAHGQPGARLGVLRLLGHEALRADLAEQLEAVKVALGRGELDEGLAQVVVDRQRGVRGGVGAAGDAGLDTAERDRVGDLDGGGQAGTAGLLHVVGRGRRVEDGADDGLAGEVEVAGVLEHGAGDDGPEALALQVVAAGQPVDRRGEHVLVGGVRVLAVRAGEGDSVAADDGDLAGACGHVCHSRLFSVSGGPKRGPGSIVTQQ